MDKLERLAGFASFPPIECSLSRLWFTAVHCITEDTLWRIAGLSEYLYLRECIQPCPYILKHYQDFMSHISCHKGLIDS